MSMSLAAQPILPAVDRSLRPSSRRGYARFIPDELPFCGISLADIRLLPKVDLHRHLVGAIRPEVLVRTARRIAAKLTLGEDVDHVRSKLVLRDPGVCDYATFLRKRSWGEFKAILASELGCANAVYWAIADANADGVAYVEFRVAPYGIGPDQRMTISQFLCGLRRGLRAAKRDFASTDARFIFSLGRRAVVERWPVQMRSKFMNATVKTAAANRDLVVGLDLCGDEDRFPNRGFVDLAELAKTWSVPLTVHAGETGRPESVWEAIETLHADRIGHGIAAHKDAALQKRLAEARIPLEVCYTSNYLLGVVEREVEHPFALLHQAGVNVTVNTDDPILFDDTTLSREYYSLVRANLITPADLPELLLRAADASFLPPIEKAVLRGRLDQTSDLSRAVVQ